MPRKNKDEKENEGNNEGGQNSGDEVNPLFDPNAGDAYEQSSQQEPAREIEIPTVEEKKEESQPGTSPAAPMTLSQAIDTSSDLTDTQFIIKKLMPDTLKLPTDWAVGRVEPSVFLAALHLVSTNEIMLSDPKKDIDVNSIYMKNYVAISKGLDGMGIIDLLEIAGAAREDKKLKGILGFGNSAAG